MQDDEPFLDIGPPVPRPVFKGSAPVAEEVPAVVEVEKPAVAPPSKARPWWQFW